MHLNFELLTTVSRYPLMTYRYVHVRAHAKDRQHLRHYTSSSTPFPCILRGQLALEALYQLKCSCGSRLHELPLRLACTYVTIGHQRISRYCGQKFKVQMCVWHACSSSYARVTSCQLLALDWLANSSLFTLFQVAFGPLIAFSTSLEGSAIEIKPAAPVPVDTAVSLKAQLAKSGHNLRMKRFYRNRLFNFLSYRLDLTWIHHTTTKCIIIVIPCTCTVYELHYNVVYNIGKILT